MSAMECCTTETPFGKSRCHNTPPTQDERGRNHSVWSNGALRAIVANSHWPGDQWLSESQVNALLCANDGAITPKPERRWSSPERKISLDCSHTLHTHLGCSGAIQKS